MPTPYHEVLTTNTSPPPAAAADNKWGPYSGPADFSANMVITLVVLFSALLLGLAINFIVRFLLCTRRRAAAAAAAADPEKAAAAGKAGPSPADALPALVFSAGTKLAGTAADCAICLAEFVDGDRVRVMPACNHGFHVRCIEQWLASRISCPTCRASCLATVTVAATPAAAASRVEMV